MLVFFITLDTSLFEFVPALGGPNRGLPHTGRRDAGPQLQMLSVSS